MSDATNERVAEAWPPMKKAIWDVLMDANLNVGYLAARPLTEKLYAAALAAAAAENDPSERDNRFEHRALNVAELDINTVAGQRSAGVARLMVREIVGRCVLDRVGHLRHLSGRFRGLS